MSNALRLLVMAAALNIAAAAVAAAQTVIVRGVAPGQTVELFVNTTPAGSSEAGSDGIATVNGTIPPNDQGRPEMDARVHVDSCGTTHRVYVMNRNLPQPTRETGCERRDISGIFWVRQRSTLVVDISGTIPTLLLRQGSYDPNATVRVRRQAPRGIVLFGGGGWGTFSNLSGAGCGNVTDCVGDDSGGAYSVGAHLWLTPWFGGEVAFVKPASADYRGGGTNFDFTHTFEADILTVGGLLAAPLGPVRLYGKVGGSFHKGVTLSTQTQQEITIPVEDGDDIVLPAGEQIWAVETEGWSWYAGGGFEGWVTSRFALYTDITVARIRGESTSGTDMSLKQRATTVTAGVRLRIF